MQKKVLGRGIGLSVLAMIGLAACGGGGNKRVYFANLEEGANVESPFKVQMKTENLIVEPAALGVNDGHGHFHILVDEPLAPPSGPIPKDAKHIHYGDGQTEATLDLPVGQHTLLLQFAKGNHVPYDPPIYQEVRINVTRRNAPDTVTAKPADTAAAKPDGVKVDSAAKAPQPKAEPVPAKPAGSAAKKPSPKKAK